VPPRLRTAIYSVASVVFVSKVLGFLRGMVIADKFGTSAAYDLYLIAIILPALASGVLGYACYYQFVPFLTRQAERAGSDRSAAFWRPTWSTVNLTLLIGAVATLAIVLAAPYIMKIWDTGYLAGDFNLIVFYSRVTAASVLLSVTEAFMRALLNVRKTYTYPAIGLSLFNLFSIAAVLLWHQRFSVGAVAVGLVGGLLIQNLFLALKLIRLRPFEHFRVTIIDKGSPLFLSVASTLILVELINRSYFMIDRYFAPHFGDGVISALSYGQILVQLPESIVGFAIGAVMFPVFSRQSDDVDTTTFAAAYRKGVTAALLFAAPLAVFFYVNAESLVYTVFHRGVFDDRSAAMTTSILRTLAPSIIALFVVSMSIRACYARGWSRPVLVFSVMLLFIKFGATALLPRWLDYPGISAASSLSLVLFAILLMLYIVRRWPREDMRSFGRTMFKLGAAGLLAYAAAYGFQRLIWPSAREMTHVISAVTLAASGGVVFGSYGIAAWLLGLRRQFAAGGPSEGAAEW